MPDIFQRIAVHALYATVLNFIHEYNIFSNILHIDIALSGGADSVGLAALLAAYRHQSGANVSLRTHHIRHGLRNDAYDSEIARTTAEKLALPHIETLLNLGDVACNVEAVARSARYEAFFGALANEQNAALALAHHGDENVETAIWRLGRGCGAEGLCMPPVRIAHGIRLVRPLLACSKADICQFLRDIGLEWAEDPTNNNDIYTRNRIRHEILPNIMQVSTAGANVYRSLLNVAQDASAVSSFAEYYANAHEIDAKIFYVSRKEWNVLHIGAQSQVLRHMARCITPQACPSHDWIMRALAMIRQNAQTHRLCACGSMAIYASSRGFCATAPAAQSSIWQAFDVPACNATPFDVAGFGSLAIFRAAACDEMPNTPHFASFCIAPDAALRLCPAHEFDTLTTSDGRVTKTREALRSQGVPEPLRAQWPVLCDGKTPLWVVGGMRTAGAPKARPHEIALFVRWSPKIEF